MWATTTLMFGFLLLRAAALCAEVTVTLRVEPSTITIEENTALRIKISGAPGKVPRPNVAKIADFDVINQSSSVNFSSVNGVSETSTTYTLVLSPKRKGTFNLGPAIIQVAGQTYQSQAVTVKVIDAPPPGSIPTNPKNLFLQAEVNNARPYVGQQVLLTVKFFHAVEILSQPSYTPPQTTDFWNDMIIPQRSYYSNIGGKRYRVLEIKTALFPTRPGKLKIGRAFLETQIRSTRRRNTFGFGSLFDRGETVSLRTRPIEIKVQPLPTTGKPVDFSGAVGDYHISATADLLEVEVNTPVTVSFFIRGQGNIKVLPKPQMPPAPDFRVYSGASEERITKGSDILGGVKTFEEVFIPTRQGQLSIPAVSYSFFDPQKKKYRTVSTKPISISASSTLQSLATEVPFTGASGGRIAAGMRSIRYLKKSSSAFQPQGATLIFKRSYLVLNAIPVLALLALAVYRRRSERLRTDTAYARSRSAARQAKLRLKSASAFASVDTAEKFFGEIRLAVFAFVADRLNISHHGLTLDQLSDTLQRAKFSEAEIRECRQLLQRADFVRYSTGSISSEDIAVSLRKAEEILVRLQEANLGENR